MFQNDGRIAVSYTHLTQEGLKMAISMAIRLTLLIIGSSVMTLTTTPVSYTHLDVYKRQEGRRREGKGSGDEY